MLSYTEFIDFCKNNNKNTFCVECIEKPVKSGKFARYEFNHSGNTDPVLTTENKCTPYEAVMKLMNEDDFNNTFDLMGEDYDDEEITYEMIMESYFSSDNVWIEEYNIPII